ncbi:hypothetical protein J5X75_29300 [Actinoplanes sp. NEAU-H7]|uniref:Uncharacterized protein n=1 Tax=Actinoplanes flavus TaxID=2820290 RepID=A0ABS3USR3_9ACTN|nr:hypothetical protein [Actinoplanes flavus]
MTVVNEQKSRENFGTPKTAPDQQHPAWCDPSRCTADPSTQADGYRSGVGSEHRSADVPLNIGAGSWPIPPTGVAFLTEAVAPWRCSTFLRIVVDGGTEVSMAVESALPLLAALTDLVAFAVIGEAVSRR